MAKSKQKKRSKSSGHNPIKKPPANPNSPHPADPNLPTLFTSLRSPSTSVRDASLSALSTLYQTTSFNTSNKLFSTASLSAIAICTLSPDLSIRLNATGALLNFLLKNNFDASANEAGIVALSNIINSADMITPLTAAVTTEIQKVTTAPAKPPAKTTTPEVMDTFLPTALRVISQLYESYPNTIPLTITSPLIATVYSLTTHLLLPDKTVTLPITTLPTTLRILHTISESQALPPALLADLPRHIPSLAPSSHLHAIGALLSDSANQTSSAFVTNTIASLAPLPTLLLPSLPTLYQSQKDSFAAYEEELKEASVEESIANDIVAENETAMDIAKRLKKAKADAGARPTDAGDAAMEDNEEVVVDSGGEDKRDLRGAHENNLQAWSEHCLVLNLFFEVVTNLTITASGGESGECVDYDSDEEVMEGFVNDDVKQGGLASLLESEGKELVAQCGRVVEFMGAWKTQITGGEMPSKAIQDEITAILDRAYSCLNTLLTLTPGAITPQVGVALMTALCRNGFESSGGSMYGCMKALLNAREELVPMIDEEVLRMVMKGGAVATSPEAECRRGAVSVLAQLCAGVHSEVVGRAVTEFLMSVLLSDPNVMVADEVLNAIMDMYGSDDCHKGIYNDLRVGVVVQEQIVFVKKKGKEAGGEENMQVKETLLNMKRFAKYMQSHN